MFIVLRNNTIFISLGAFAASELDVVFSGPDDDDRDGHRNVGTIRTPNAADSPRRLHQTQSLKA
jgi:hypothetical protein